MIFPGSGHHNPSSLYSPYTAAAASGTMMLADYHTHHGHHYHQPAHMNGQTEAVTSVATSEASPPTPTSTAPPVMVS